MARKADTKHVTARMYRHFAALTIAATIALALFSSGENLEANAREVAQADDHEPVSSGELAAAEATASAHSFSGGGSDVAFGAPTSPVGGSGLVRLGTLSGSGIGLPSSYTKYGISAADWERLTPDQRKKLKEKVAAEEQASRSEDRDEQVERLLAGSAARSTG